MLSRGDTKKGRKNRPGAKLAEEWVQSEEEPHRMILCTAHWGWQQYPFQQIIATHQQRLERSSTGPLGCCVRGEAGLGGRLGCGPWSGQWVGPGLGHRHTCIRTGSHIEGDLTRMEYKDVSWLAQQTRVAPLTTAMPAPIRRQTEARS